MPDPTIVAQAATGDRDAFDVLVEGSIDRLYAVARLIVRDVDLAEDAVQDALVRCWERLPGLRDPERFDAWLHRLLVNAALDHYRARRRFQAVVSLLPVESSVRDGSGAVAERDQMSRAFERLKIEQRTVLVLRHYVGLSTTELADALGVPAGTAKSRLHYATEALRAAIDADERGDSARKGTA